MAGLKRGDLVIAAPPGDYGKPRPVLIVQDDAFAALPSVTVLPLTSDVHTASLLRVTIEPDTENALEKPSQVMVDKAVTLPRTKVGRRIGRIDVTTLEKVSAALARFLGLA